MLVVLPAVLMGHASRDRGSVEAATHAAMAFIGPRAAPYLADCPPTLLSYVVMTLGFGRILLAVATLPFGAEVARARTHVARVATVGLVVICWFALLLVGLCTAALDTHWHGGQRAVAGSWAGALAPLVCASELPHIGFALAVGTCVRKRWLAWANLAAVLTIVALLGIVDGSIVDWGVAPGALERLLYSGRPELSNRALAGEALWFMVTVCVAGLVLWWRELPGSLERRGRT